MTRKILLISPLVIKRSRSKPFALNLNIYRNTHYKTLNTMKIKYAELMHSQISKLIPFSSIRITYTVFPKTKRLLDISNVCSVVDKFFCDALVSEGKIPDDNYKYLQEVDYRMGHVDKDVPRVEILIEGY